MNKQITIRMLAYTDAAGKYNPDAPMNGNEDNFYVDDNLADDIPNHCDADKITQLSDCGLLMVVADGMGGMNAGEVASKIAIDTVKEYFAPGKISPEMAATHKSRKQYLENVVDEADKRIKIDSEQNEKHYGMGSTIILVWIVGNELTLTWCGDSRAYRYNPVTGIELLSEDHSYVQDLVREGIITYEQTFNHPHGNIVTRSLGDPDKKAMPETRFFNIYKSDIIFLCSDGLSGVLRDRKTYDENGQLYPEANMEDIIRANSSSLSDCRKALWEAAEKADWYDNVTLILCQMLDGLKKPVKIEPKPDPVMATKIQKSFWNKSIIKFTPKKLLIIAIAVLIIVGGIVTGVSLKKQKSPKPKADQTVEETMGDSALNGKSTMKEREENLAPKGINAAPSEKSPDDTETQEQPEQKINNIVDDPKSSESPVSSIKPSSGENNNPEI